MEYVPVKQRKIPEKDLTPNLATFQSCLPDLRKRSYNWYPGPEILGHRMHWSEWFFGVLFLFAILLYFIGASVVPTWAYGMLLWLVSITALGFVWGFAKYKSLATVTEQLEKAAIENHAEVQAYTAINQEWDKGLQQSQENLSDFTRDLGLVEEDAQKIHEVEQSLASLVGEKKRQQVQEKALFEAEKKYQRVVRGNIEEQQRRIMKEKLLKLYAKIDRRGDGSGILDSKEEIGQLREALNEDPLLNAKDEAGNRRFHWEAEFEAMASDGQVERWELLEALDRVTESYYFEMKRADKSKQELEAKMYDLQQKAQKTAVVIHM